MMREKLLAVLFLGFIAIVLSLPQQSKSKRPTPVFKQPATGGLLLPDNATLIRDNIVDTFSCENRVYGYYADLENECQVFHVCLPQTRGSIRWSFICPAETVFQSSDICMYTDRKFDTMRGIGEILRFERGDWQGSGRGRGGRSRTRKGKHHEDF